jgi:hypothetical protein
VSILDRLYNELTRKAQLGNKDITRKVVEDWVGTEVDPGNRTVV